MLLGSKGQTTEILYGYIWKTVYIISLVCSIRVKTSFTSSLVRLLDSGESNDTLCLACDL